MLNALILVLVVQQFLDLWTTLRVLDLGGREANPLVLLVARLVGVRCAVVMAKIAGLGICALFWRLPAKPAVAAAVACAVAVYCVVLWNNFRVVASLRADRASEGLPC